MKDSGLKWVGQIPAGWEVSRNKYVMHKEKQINEIWHGENVLSLSVNGVIVRDLANPSGKMPKTFDGYQSVRAGDLLMCLFDIDVTPRCVGRADVEGVTSPAYSRYRVEKTAERNFVYYYYLMMDYTKELVHLAKNLRHALPDEEFRKLPIILPPLPEQRAIAARLDALTGRIESESKKIAAEIERLEQYKKSFITEAVCGRCIKSPRPMKDSGIPWVGKIPEEWGEHPLFIFVRQVKNRNFGLKEKNLLSLSYGKIKRKDINSSGGLMPENYEGYNIISKGDIVLRLTDLQNDKRSIRVGLAKEQGIVTSAYVTLRPNDKCSSEFLAYSILVFDIKKGFYGIGSGVRQGLTYDEVKRLVFAFPPLAEQREIAAAIDATCAKVDAIVAKRKRQLDRLDALKRSLVYEYVTGKKDIEIEDRGSTK